MKNITVALRQNIVGEFPRKLVNRNQFDDLDVAVAMDIVQRLIQHAVTKETEDLLRKHNITRKNNQQLRGIRRFTPPTDEPVPFVCAFFRLTAPLPEHSKIVKCETCKATLIAHGMTGVNAKYFCCFCIADHALEEYWKRKDSRKKK